MLIKHLVYDRPEDMVESKVNAIPCELLTLKQRRTFRERVYLRAFMYTHTHTHTDTHTHTHTHTPGKSLEMRGRRN